MRFALALIACACLAGARIARGADLNVTLPNVSGIPGSLVDVPITVSPSPTGLGILSIDFRLTLDPAVVFGSLSEPDGWLQSWGAAYSNGTATFVAAVAAGTTPVVSASALLNTVQIRIKPSAVIGTTMPLTFQHILFNEGTPTVAVTAGSLHVNAPPASAPPPAAGAFAFALASANPVRDAATFACSAPAGSEARLAIFGVDGRVVRTFTLAGGVQGVAVRWDLRDAQGTRVPPGVYLARAAQGGRSLTRRVVVLE